jgi:hypothetical protein
MRDIETYFAGKLAVEHVLEWTPDGWNLQPQLDKDGTDFMQHLWEQAYGPSYYRVNGLEAIDVIEKWGLNYNLGNVIKYVCRADKKDNLRKAIWYLNREINN